MDVLTTANVLSSADGERPLFRVGLGGSGAPAWAPLLASEPLSGRAPPDLIIMPGLGLSSAKALARRLDDPDMVEAGRKLADAVAQASEIATSCSGAFLLAKAGLLSGRRATTSWWLAPLFQKLHPDVDLVMDRLIVRDGAITTAGAALAQMDLMLNIVARFGGPAIAGQCSQYLLLDERRSQSRYMALSFLAATDGPVARAEAWARARLSENLTIADLATAAGLAPRTFARRVDKVTGLSPIRFLQRLRIEAATEMIETTKLPVEEIARRVGYADPSALRRIMRREGGLRPSNVRRAAIAT
jgi:transcriptional regulator GlxA family with amidase domain